MPFRMLFCIGFLVDKGMRTLIWQSNTRNSFSFLFFSSLPDPGQLEPSFAPLILGQLSWWLGISGNWLNLSSYWKWVDSPCCAMFGEMQKVTSGRDFQPDFLRNVTYHEPGLQQQQLLNLCLVDSEVCYKKNWQDWCVNRGGRQCAITQGAGGLTRYSSPGRCCQALPGRFGGGTEVGNLLLLPKPGSASACWPCWPVTLQIVFCVRQLRKLLLSLAGKKERGEGHCRD